MTKQEASNLITRVWPTAAMSGWTMQQQISGSLLGSFSTVYTSMHLLCQKNHLQHCGLIIMYMKQLGTAHFLIVIASPGLHFVNTFLISYTKWPSGVQQSPWKSFIFAFNVNQQSSSMELTHLLLSIFSKFPFGLVPYSTIRLRINFWAHIK